MANEIIFTILSDLLFILILFGGGYLFARSFYKIYAGISPRLNGVFAPVNKFFNKLSGNDPSKEMTAKEYIIHILLFSGISFVIGYVILLLQHMFILNPNGIEGMSWDLAFNTMASFVTNTNWQAYSGEAQASYLTQTLVFTVQNFISGAAGICVLFALIRGICNKEKKTIGNFYSDLFKIIINVMIPVCLVMTLVLVSQGTPQTFNGNVTYTSLEGASSTLYLGPVASQISIKQLFTNGGGYYGYNSAYPFENPTNLTNIIQCLAILVISCGLVMTFGMAIKKHRQSNVILGVMTTLFVVGLIVTTTWELSNPNGITNNGYLTIGNMEGKEARFGPGLSSLWAIATTSASNGSVNAMHDSLTSIGGMIPIFLMMLGEIVFGGVGCGLYGMLAFVILTVFIAGLMVGRTPEYLGKKIGSFDMKMTCLIFLPPILTLLLGTAATVCLSGNVTGIVPTINGGNNPAHFFSEILYAFASMSGNNGSAFGGLGANTPWMNMIGGIIMLITRFVPIIAVLLLAQNLGSKKLVPESNGTLKTDNLLFGGLLLAIIIIVGALSFFPALALGPIAEALL